MFKLVSRELWKMFCRIFVYSILFINIIHRIVTLIKILEINL